MSGGLLYFYRTYTSAVSGSRQKRETCSGCSCSFEYTITRTAYGGGHSPFLLRNSSAADDAKSRARANLIRALDEAVEPASCPLCGIYQPDMVQVLRDRLGKRFDPNKYAAERIKYPAADLWRAAGRINTRDAYKRFIEVWPTLDAQAKQKIGELRYPPYVRKLVGRLGWVLWGALALGCVGFAVAGIVMHR